MPSGFNSSRADPPRVLVGEILSGSMLIVGALDGDWGPGATGLLGSGEASEAVPAFEMAPSAVPTPFSGRAVFCNAVSGNAASDNDVVFAGLSFKSSG